MVSLILANLLQVAVEGGIKAGISELLLCELLQSLAVEGVLEVFQGKGIVKDISWIQMLAIY
jgi:hypothetical protein